MLYYYNKGDNYIKKLFNTYTILKCINYINYYLFNERLRRLLLLANELTLLSKMIYFNNFV